MPLVIFKKQVTSIVKIFQSIDNNTYKWMISITAFFKTTFSFTLFLITVLLLASNSIFSDHLRRERFFVSTFEYTGDTEEAWLAYGFRQTFIDNLSKIDSIEVVSRREEEQIETLVRDKEKAGEKFDRLIEVSKLVKADYLISSLLENKGKILSFTLHIQKPPEYHIVKTIKIHGKKNNILDIQDQLIAAIVNRLDIQISPTDRQFISKGHIYFIKDFETYSKGLENLSKNLDKSLEYFLKMHKDSPSYWNVTKDIAWVYSKKEDYKKTIEFYTKERLLLEKQVGVYTWNYTICLDNLGVFNTKINDKKSALEYFSESLRIRDSMRLSNSKEYSSSLDYIAWIYNSLRKRQQSITFYRTSNQKRETLGLKSSYDYASALNEIGILNRQAKKFKDAMSNFIESIAILEEINLVNTNIYANVLYNRGMLYSKENNYDGAIADFKNTILLKEKLETYDITYSRALNDLGAVYSNLEIYDEAISYYKKLVKLKQKQGEKYSLEYSTACYNLADTYHKYLGNSCEAEKWIKEVVIIDEKIKSKYATEDKEYYKLIQSKCVEGKENK